jgi:universal stress protein A
MMYLSGVAVSLEDQAMLSFKTILHPTDFSPPSEKAYRLACTLADPGASVVHVCHVLPVPVLAYGEVVTDLNIDAAKESAKKQLAEIPTPPGIEVQRHFCEGDPAAEIVRLAKERGADVIVLGTHGRTGLLRLLMGSVAEHILRHAPCPVLIIKS